MGFLLIVISFLSLLFLYSKYHFESFEVLLYSFFSQLILFVLVAEVLSALRLLDSHYIFLFWVSIDFALLLVCLILNKGKKWSLHIKIPAFKHINIIFYAIFLLLFFQALVYPPNNYDAMTYHLARIPHWLSNHSLEHYPTNIFRQLYQPPLSSIILLQINVLTGSDILSNTLQVFFLLMSLSVTKQIGAELGIKKQGLMLLLIVTIPAVVLQASSVTNNIIESSFVLIALLYALKIKKEIILRNFIVLGISAGFCMLTKGTAYLFILPILALCGLSILIHTKRYIGILMMLLSLIIALSINAFHYHRNYQLVGNILGTDQNESQMYANTHLGGKEVLSNVIKNIGNHLGPKPINQLAEKGIYKIHELVNININEPGVNFNDFNYHITSSPNTEDNAPNFIHLLLIIITSFVLVFSTIRGKVSKSSLFIFEVVLLQFLLFCIMLKWQPWHSRNHIAMFVECVPLISFALLDNFKKKSLLKLFVFLIVAYAIGLIVFNRLRPLISFQPYTSAVSINSDKATKYYADRLEVVNDYKSIMQILDHQKYSTIGVNIFWNEYEYPFFRDCYNKRISPYHIFEKTNPSIKIDNKKLIPDFIISNRIYLEEIDFKKIKYYKITKDNTNIALFRRAD